MITKDAVFLKIFFISDPEELLSGEAPSACPSSNTEAYNVLLLRAQAAEERAHSSEDALARAMEDLHKLKLVTFRTFPFLHEVNACCSSHCSPAGGHSELPYADMRRTRWKKFGGRGMI